MKFFLKLFLITALCGDPHMMFYVIVFFRFMKISHMDSVTSLWTNTIGLALSTMQTLRFPQVLDKHDHKSDI